MSVEFYNKIEELKEVAYDIAMLEGSHSFLLDKYIQRVEKQIESLKELRSDIKQDLSKMYSKEASLKNKSATKKKRKK